MPAFTQRQRDLTDSISLSLEKLDSILFFLENHQEDQHAHSVKYPNLSITFEPRALSLLYMAGEMQREIRQNFEKLLGDN